MSDSMLHARVELEEIAGVDAGKSLEGELYIFRSVDCAKRDDQKRIELCDCVIQMTALEVRHWIEELQRLLLTDPKDNSLCAQVRFPVVWRVRPR